jgi:hypothetical protein
MLVWYGIGWLWERIADALQRRDDRIIAKERKAFEARERLRKAEQQDKQAAKLHHQLLMQRKRGRT